MRIMWTKKMYLSKLETRNLKLEIRFFALALLLLLTTTVFAGEQSYHLGIGAASDGRFGLAFTGGAGLQAGEIPLTILKTELVGGVWYIKDNETGFTLCDDCEISTSWLGFYQGARLQLSGGQIGAAGLPTTQGVGLAVHETFPSLKDGGFGKTETYIAGMGFIRYDLNPGKPVGLFLEGEAVLKLTNRTGQDSPLEMVMGKLGLRLPTVFKR